MHNRTIVFSAACAGMLLFGIGLITLGSVAPHLTQKLNLDEVSAGTLFSILPFGILAGSLIFGPLTDRYGYKPIMVISCIAMFAGFEGIAFATSSLWLKLFILSFGIAAGSINGTTNALVSDISKHSKGANLSLLGVFFGIGALGMPFMLAGLKNSFSYETVIAFVGLFTLLIGILFLFIRFPPPKSAEIFSFQKNKNLFKDSLLISIAFFLFCQSSFEAIINNWTTTFLIDRLKVSERSALYALTLYLLGMTVTRLISGTVLRAISPGKLLTGSIIFMVVGSILLHVSASFPFAVAALVLLGAGLAAGFPVMLGFVGNMYSKQSGTAFSFVLVIALLGNMLVNYLMGIIARSYGIRQLTLLIFGELMIMILITIIIFRMRKQQTPET